MMLLFLESKQQYKQKNMYIDNCLLVACASQPPDICTCRDCCSPVKVVELIWKTSSLPHFSNKNNLSSKKTFRIYNTSLPHFLLLRLFGLKNEVFMLNPQLLRVSPYLTLFEYQLLVGSVSRQGFECQHIVSACQRRYIYRCVIGYFLHGYLLAVE